MRPDQLERRLRERLDALGPAPRAELLRSVLQLPRISPQEMRFLSPREVQDLTEQFDDRFKPLISTAAYLGLRWSELVALRSEDVVLPARRLSVTHTLVEVTGGSMKALRRLRKAFGRLRSQGSLPMPSENTSAGSHLVTATSSLPRRVARSERPSYAGSSSLRPKQRTCCPFVCTTSVTRLLAS